MSILRSSSSNPISPAIRLPITLRHPAKAARTYSTGLGAELVPPKSWGSSTIISKLRALTIVFAALAFWACILNFKSDIIFNFLVIQLFNSLYPAKITVNEITNDKDDLGNHWKENVILCLKKCNIAFY